MSLPIRIAHIGAGPFSRANHSPALKRLSSSDEPVVSMEAICDLDRGKAEAFQHDFGYKAIYTDLHEMIAEVQPEALYVTVHPAKSAGVLAQVLPYGIPTFTEKPPGVTVEESEKLAALADEHGTLTYVGFNRRQVPGLCRLKQWMGENAPIRYLRAEMIRNNRTEPEFAVGTGIHALDCLRFLCGNVVTLEAHSRWYGETRVRDLLVRIQFDTGILADLAILVCAGVSRELYLAQGEDRMMESTVGHGYTSPQLFRGERVYANNAIVAELPVEEDALVAGGILGEHLAFLDAVRTGVLPGCCLQDARHSLRLAVAVSEDYCGPIDQFVASGVSQYT